MVSLGNSAQGPRSYGSRVRARLWEERVQSWQGFVWSLFQRKEKRGVEVLLGDLMLNVQESQA